MTNRFLAPVLLALAVPACAVDDAGDDIDDAVLEEEAAKADEVQAYKHYLLVTGDPGEQLTGRYLVRAGGGKLRCPDDVVRERCEIDAQALVPTLGLDESPEAVVDEIETHPMIARGRLVRTDEGRVYLRMSALTRGITSVMPTVPTGTCYRITPAGTGYKLTKLDAPSVTVSPTTLYWDDVDPTPDFWGQPTPAVQRAIDDALAVSGARPVYTCGSIEKRDAARWLWAEQVFAPK